MDKYESPTIEQAGGPNNHIEPNAYAPTIVVQVNPNVYFSNFIGIVIYIAGS